MSFRWRYRSTLIALLTVFAGLVWAIAYVTTQTQYFFTSIVLVLVTVVLVVSLIYLWERQLRILSNFFESAKQGDFTQGFTESGLGRELANELNNLSLHFQQSASAQRAEISLLTSIIRQAPIAIITFDNKGRVHIFNQAASVLLNIKAPSSVNEILIDGHTLLEILNQDVLEQNTIKISQDGIVLNLKFSVSSVFLLDSEQKVVTVENIGKQINQAEYEAWRSLIGVLTHEMMNSITPIVSLADNCKDILNHSSLFEALDNTLQRDLEDVQRAVATISNRSQGIMSFVDGYRRLSKVPQPKKESVGLQGLIQSVVALCGDAMSNKNIRYCSEVLPTDLKIFADHQLVEQILINLLNNAIDACEKNGQIKLRGKLQKSNVIVEIIDDGCGMDSHVLTQVFTPFYTTKRTGTGIGMSLVRQIMYAHGGQVTLSSERNRGTKVSLVFQ
ncbi:sensor histidine kinase [Agaribacter flavus]|uniref:histidine kinase n=1 Tax=Agaribacter flavus TaxID=1902781 RepID=A0ABV7FRY8_9ALTE